MWPVDEGHPLWPHETYSLSKHFGERIGANYAQAFGMEVISLRYVWVWVKRDEAGARQIVGQARAGLVPEVISGFGAHIGVRDMARACACAAVFAFPPGTEVPFEAFFLAARNTFHPLPTLQLLERSFGECPPVRDAAYFAENPFASVFDIRKASRLLGWEPQLDWRELEQWEF
jgi:UDP-glucose 4-epimerase